MRHQAKVQEAVFYQQEYGGDPARQERLAQQHFQMRSFGLQLSTLEEDEGRNQSDDSRDDEPRRIRPGISHVAATPAGR